MPSKIPWTTETWNPFHGCTPVSAGCLHCWAKPMAKRLAAMGVKGYTKKDPFAVRLMPDKLDEPYHWRKPRLVFPGSMGDMFHKSIPTRYIKKMFGVMADCPQHIFQVLTKRPARMATHVNRHGWPENVWLGTSIEDDRVLDERMQNMTPWHFGRPGLSDAPRKFVSWEPAIGYVDWSRYLHRLNWLIIGCESGPKRRPFSERWAIEAIAECRTRSIPVFVKQVPVYSPEDPCARGRVSTNPDEWARPELRVQEYPEAMMRVLGATA